MAVIDPSAVWDFAGEIVGRIVPSRATTTATVTRIDADGTVWVSTGDGGEAPAASAAAGVSVGDTVTLEWDGSAMGIRSNVSNPAPAGSVVRLAVDRAQGVASAAQRVADAVNQHFFADGNGIHVTEATQDEWNANHTGANVLINSIGQLFRDGLNNLLTLTTENGARALTVWDGLGNTADHIRAIIGETIQLGNASSGNVMTINASGMKVSTSPANDMMNLGLGLRAQEVRQFSDSAISSVPHALTLSYTPQGGSIVVYQGIGSSYNPPEGESTYQYTISGKTLTITDSRLVGYKYLVEYTATDFEAVSLAVGSYVKADGARTIASGTGSEALGENSLASGYHARALGKASHAEGEWTKAIGWAAHAEGEEVTASGNFSHAEGYKTRADGDFSHAQNRWTVAASEDQTALGRYNVEDPYNVYAVIVGNGRGGNRSNAFAVRWNGNVECAGTISPTATASTVTASSGASVTGDNACWTNGAATAFVLVFKCSSSLASNGTLTVGTLPEGYRPPYNLAVDVYTSAVAHVVGYVSTDGIVSIRNVGSSALATTTTLRVSSMWAVS